MTNPYFQSDNYKDSPAGKFEKKVENKINKIKLFFGKKKK
jgi:hypothetical protein